MMWWLSEGRRERKGAQKDKKGEENREEREVNVIVKNTFNVLKRKEALYILGFWSPQERSTMYSGIWEKAGGEEAMPRLSGYSICPLG